MTHNIQDVKPGSAWDTWRKAGAEWRAHTWATGPVALLIAANAYASYASGENERKAKKRAFIEGAVQ